MPPLPERAVFVGVRRLGRGQDQAVYQLLLRGVIHAVECRHDFHQVVTARAVRFQRKSLAAQSVNQSIAVEAHLLKTARCGNVHPPIGNPSQAVHRHLAAQHAVLAHKEWVIFKLHPYFEAEFKSIVV